MKQPSPSTAWCSTCAASLMLVSFGFLIASNASDDILAIAVLALAVVALVLSATNEWKKYFERFVRYEIEHESRCGGQVADRPESEEP